MKRFFLMLMVLGCCMRSASGQARYSPPEHAARLLVLEDGVIQFIASDGETLAVTVAPHGIRVGDFEFSARRIGSDAHDAKFEVMVQRGPRRVVNVLAFDSSTHRPDQSKLHDVSKLLDDFNASAEGKRFQEFRRYIVADVFRSSDQELFTSTVDRSMAGIHPTMISLWDCTSAILNAAAAAATMVVGCATPSCGPYWGYCCFSGIAWYASALIDVAESCNFEE